MRRSSESDDEDHKGSNGKKKNGKQEAPEPKVGPCISQTKPLQDQVTRCEMAWPWASASSGCPCIHSRAF